MTANANRNVFSTPSCLERHLERASRSCSIDQGNWRVGDRVAVQPSTGPAEDLHRRGTLRRGKVLIKRMAAGQVDEVCWDGVEVTVHGFDHCR